jgi:glutamyl-tRNA reductase
VLESFTVGTEELPKALHDLVGRDHVNEAVVLSTCMRTEVYAEVSRFHGAVGDIRTFLADWSGHPPEVFSDFIYEFYDDSAVRHLLRVAGGLDSAVLGEGEILRQVRSAWEVARTEGASRAGLGIVFRQALETGKRVRTETAIARGTTSLSHTAISLAGSVGAPLAAVPPAASACPVVGHGVSPDTAHAAHRAGASTPPGSVSETRPGSVSETRPGSVSETRPGSVSETRPPATLAPAAGESSGPPCAWAQLLAGRTILVIGAGEMGRAVATLAAGAPHAGPVLVANRTFAHAAALAGRIGVRAVAWSELAAALVEADIVLSSTGSPDAVLQVTDVSRALAARPDRPVVVVDIAVPRDIDPAVGALEGVTLFDMVDLQAHAEAALDGRRAEVPKAEAIVDEEVARYHLVAAQREVAPVVAGLHQRAEAVRLAETARLEARLVGLDDRQRRAVESLTRGIVAKLLHEPTINLKRAAADERSDGLVAALEELFEL